MKLRRLEQLYMGILLVIFAGIVIHAPLTVWLSSLAPAGELLIKSWKELLMLAAVPIALILVTEKGLWTEFRRDWLFRVIVWFALLHFLTLLIIWNGVTPALAGLSIDLRWLLYFSLVYALMRIQPGYRGLFIKVGIGGALVVGLFALLQVTILPKDILAGIGYDKETTIAPYLTVDQNEDFVRINSTMRGPNPLGAYMVIVVSMLLAFLVGRKRQAHTALSAFLGLTAAVGLWWSYSRSALLAAALGAAVIGYSQLRKGVSKIVWISGFGVLAVIVGLTALLWQTQFVQQVIVHEDPQESGMINSNDGHLESLKTGVERLVQQPFGGGVGSTGSASLYGEDGFIVENQYLFIAHEVGWSGLILFIGVFVFVMQRLWRKRADWLALGVFASGMGLAFIGLLLPVWADDTVAIIWWGLAAIALGGNYGKKRARN